MPNKKKLTKPPACKGELWLQRSMRFDMTNLILVTETVRLENAHDSTLGVDGMFMGTLCGEPSPYSIGAIANWSCNESWEWELLASSGHDANDNSKGMRD